MPIEVREIAEGDSERLAQAFAGTPWDRPDRGPGYFEALRAEQARGHRVVFVGLAEGAAVGHGSLVWRSAYPPFREEAIPEVEDLTVAPPFRRRGIASRILDLAERQARTRSRYLGIGVGLHPGYRAAQRLYGLRGYVPDGRGLYCAGRFPAEGEQVVLDDALILHLVKELATLRAPALPATLGRS